jgi:hypothetical protein
MPARVGREDRLLAEKCFKKESKFFVQYRCALPSLQLQRKKAFLNLVVVLELMSLILLSLGLALIGKKVKGFMSQELQKRKVISAS